MKYLVYGSNSHTDFRKEELESLAVLHGIEVDLSSHSPDSPFFVIDLRNDEEARTLVSRSILIRGIYQLLASGDSYEALQVNLKANLEYPFPKYQDVSFRFTHEAFNTTRSQAQQTEIIESFSHLGWQGKIDMKSPDESFTVFESWTQSFTSKEKHIPSRLECVYLGRFVGSTSRGLSAVYDLKKRRYLGTTSMNAELSLVSTNQVLAAPGKIIYDPFVGTGSFLVSAAAQGAYVIGSDIDGRQIKGPKHAYNVQSNFEQYDLMSLLLDCLVFDIAHPPWHTNFRVDGIIADPPYGVRAGAKTLGRAENTRHYGRTEPALLPADDTLSSTKKYVHLKEDYIPPKKPYELADLADDLLDDAARLLLPGGRLAFWLPTVNEDYSAVDLPARDDMRLLSVSTQNFGRWSRRLLTYERIDTPDGRCGRRLDKVRMPGHREFRWKYYSRFGDGKTVSPEVHARMGSKEQEYYSIAASTTTPATPET